MNAFPQSGRPTCAALTRGLAVMLVLNALALSGILWLAAPAGYNETVLHHTWGVLTASGSDNSWSIIAIALDYVRSPHTTPLYTEIFFNRHIKFQYPPSALFALAAMQLIDPAWIRKDDFYAGALPSLDDLFGLAFVIVMALSTAALLEFRLRQTGAFRDCHRLAALRVVLSIAFALTFYPFVKSFTLGQIQVWINALFALSLLCWVVGRKATAGVLIGAICLLKPHYGVFLLWAAVRREWRFAVSCIAAGAIGLAASLAVFGLADHLDYLRALSFMSERGEAYFPNQSVNGVLNRLVGIGVPNNGNLEFLFDRFPPYNPWVYAGTLIAAAAILIPAIVHRRGEGDRALDYCTMAVSATIASPIAWEHHYGVLLPIYAVLLASMSASRFRYVWLVLSYVLVSTFIPATNLLAPSVLNVAQSYLFAGGVILLILLHTQPALATADDPGRADNSA